jgi:hypothetical protein
MIDFSHTSFDITASSGDFGSSIARFAAMTGIDDFGIRIASLVH